MQPTVRRPLPNPLERRRPSSPPIASPPGPERPPPLDDYSTIAPGSSIYSSDRHGGNLSPYDWHEGSSGIGINPSEDRILSTTFITNLLSSADDTASDDETSLRPARESRRSTRHRPIPQDEADAMSYMSEMTYPPSSRFAASPSSEQSHAFPPRSTPAMPVWHPPRTDTDPRVRPPPSSFLRRPDSGVQMSTVSEDSDTVTCEVSPSVIRTASMSQNMGARGASVVGVAPATLRKVSLQDSEPDSIRKSGPMSSEGVRDSDNYYRDSGNSRVLPAYMEPTAALLSPALPSTAGPHTVFPHRRQSMQSARSTKSYVSSFISRITSAPARSVKQGFSWLRKPLPPVPTIPHIPISQERIYRAEEENTPMPDLIDRAGALSQMLEKGHHPHWSRPDLPYGTQQLPDGAIHASGIVVEEADNRGRGKNGVKFQFPITTPLSPKIRPSDEKKRRVVVFVLATCAFIIVLVIGVVVGVTQSRKRHALPICSGNLTGNDCNMDATCVCTSSTGQCGQLAQSLVTLTPTVNKLFNTNWTTDVVADALWSVQGSPSGGNCADQAMLIDVAPTLNATASPNRTQWIQSALLWNLVQSQNLSAVSAMQNFVLHANWASVSSSDGPTTDTNSAFSMSMQGFSYDFLSQTVTQPSASFVDNGQPSSAQIAQVGDTAHSALDRMYTYAQASSTQRSTALSKYWQSVLQQKPSDLSTFMSIFSSSPILMPFDATASPGGHAISSLLTNSSSTPFPPPLACYPGLTSSQVDRVNAIETSVFGLSSMTAASQFDTDCFADRPIYGTLDVLNLRLPFVNPQTGVAQQAAILHREVEPRVVVSSGATMSILPGNSGWNLTTGQKDPREYGVLNSFNHVVLNYLSSIPDVNVAIALVKYILTSPATPPPSSSILVQQLTTIPTLEVAVFGTVNPSDIASTVSSFTTPSGDLFFGSDQASALRTWAITGTGSSVAWSENSTSPDIVRDSSLTDTLFMEVWNPVSTYLKLHPPGVVVNVGNITSSFQALNKFSVLAKVGP
ncbi:hypothetical protein PLICRDRAFT_396434 [Plicaturopsis crispa FD-325 SS-3]|nr:hypothetical protein PLICRDRAFT_396434 [Plicaturopsis crispa FD-325 SS-3]